MIAVIDYKAGNSPSVLSALNHIGVEARLVSSADGIKHADAVILPGVGSARATMDSLRELGLIDALERDVHTGGKPFLGICVGLQILFSHSEEEDTPCLGWIPGVVRRFDGARRRVPQMGWNEARWTRPHALGAGLERGAYFYFVNSYYAVPDNQSDILARTDYEGEFTSAVRRGNLYATQFHLEKSGPAGLLMLKNFAETAR